MELLHGLLLLFSALSSFPWLQLWKDLQFDAHMIWDSFLHPIVIPELSWADSLRSVQELVLSNGFNFEEHSIVTEDGYILTAHRIPCSLSHCQKEPVMLQHGLLDNSATWILFNKTYDFPYLLASEGYDVWMTNNRGTIHSLGHTDPVSHNWRETFSEYWDFTYDELAKYDVKAHLDYISSVSGSEKVIYVGHSQGTTQFWASACLDPEYLNSKVKAFVGLGPVIYVSHMWSPLAIALKNSHLIELLDYWGLGNFLVTESHLVSAGIRDLCYALPAVCWSVVELITGRNLGGIPVDLSRLNVMGSHEPGGTSIHNMNHWMQSVTSSTFKMYDFGENENMKRYEQKTPPEYDVSNLHKLNFPISLYIGLRDYLIAKEDAEALIDLLPVTIEVNWLEDYAHLDYVWSEFAKDDIFKRISLWLDEVYIQ